MLYTPNEIASVPCEASPNELEPPPRRGLIHLVACEQIGILFKQRLKVVFIRIRLLAERLERVVVSDQVNLARHNRLPVRFNARCSQ